RRHRPSFPTRRSAELEWSVFDQGAGRVDEARAIGQEVFADQGSLSFGRRLWPHDDDEPVTKRLTYRNTGDSDVTVELSVGLADPDRKSTRLNSSHVKI